MNPNPTTLPNDPPPLHMGDFYAEFEYMPDPPIATPSTDHTRMTACAHCGEVIERQFTARQRRVQADHRPRTYAAAEFLGVAEPAGTWVHLQTGERHC